METLTFEIKSNKDLITRKCDWLPDRNAPDCEATLPSMDTLSITMPEGSIGQVKVEGDLEMDLEASRGAVRVFRWSAEAREDDEGTAMITLVHARNGFDEVTVEISMEEEAELKIEDKTASSPSTGLTIVDQYGAYIVGALGAIGALIFALLMPMHRTELISGAGFIGFWTWLFSSTYDKFGLRLLGFIVAAVIMCFAMAMPDNAADLISGAGTVTALAIFFGGRD